MTNKVVPFTRKQQPQETIPYERPAVQAAMEALAPENGGNLGDLQAVAELCISIMKGVADADRDDEDAEWAEIAADTYDNLKIAETFLEKVAYIAMNDEEDA